MTGIVIRESHEKDWPVITAYMAALRQELGNYFPLADWANTADSYIQDIQNKIKKNEGVIFIAEEAGQIAGHAIGWIVDEVDHETHPDLIRHGHIEEMFIRPDCRREGIGRILLEEILSYMRGKNTAYTKLGVLANNTAAQTFYQQCGLTPYFISLKTETRLK